MPCTWLKVEWLLYPKNRENTKYGFDSGIKQHVCSVSMDCCAKSSKETTGRSTRRPSTDSTSHSFYSPTTPGRSYLTRSYAAKAVSKRNISMASMIAVSAAYVAENDFSATTKAPGLIVNDARKAMSLLSAAFYGYPQDQLNSSALPEPREKPLPPTSRKPCSTAAPAANAHCSPPSTIALTDIPMPSPI